MNNRKLAFLLTFLMIPICVSCKKKPAESVIEIIESTQSKLYSTKTLDELENMQYDMSYTEIG